MKRTLQKIFINMIPVILGVLIALFINNWKERLENEKFLSNVMDAINREMKQDAEEIKEILPVQYALIDTLQFYMDNESVSISDCVVKNKGFQVLATKNNSWWSFLNAKIEIVGYETIAMLSEIESSKQFMVLKINKMMDFIYEHSESTDSTRKRMFIIQLLNLIDSEEGLYEGLNGYLGEGEDESEEENNQEEDIETKKGS